MAFISVQTGPLGKAVARIGPRVMTLGLAAGLFWLCSFLVGADPARHLLWLVSATIALATLWLGGCRLVQDRMRLSDQSTRLLEADPVPVIVTRPQGRLVYANPAARQAFPVDRHATLAASMTRMLSGRDRILQRLETEAMTRGAVTEDLVTDCGRLRVTVHACRGAQLVWRIETSGASGRSDADPDTVPMLTVGRNDAILFMNRAARDLIGERVRSLDAICDTLPLRPGQTQPVRTQDGPLPCLVAEREGMAGRREVYLLPGGGEPDPPVVDGWAFFDDLPVALLKLDREGAIELSNRPARDLLGVGDTAGVAFGDMLEGLGGRCATGSRTRRPSAAPAIPSFCACGVMIAKFSCRCG